MPGLLTACLLVCAGSAVGQMDKNGPWHTDYVKARQLARESGKPLLVVFRCVP